MVWMQNISLEEENVVKEVEKHEILLLKCLMSLMYF